MNYSNKIIANVNFELGKETSFFAAVINFHFGLFEIIRYHVFILNKITISYSKLGSVA